jgi:hypothetical protein
LNHHTSPEFWEAFEILPVEIQILARGNYELLKDNPRHPSLHFKKVGEQWSARVGSGYRALGIDVADGILWIWIGTHAQYDKLT